MESPTQAAAPKSAIAMTTAVDGNAPELDPGDAAAAPAGLPQEVLTEGHVQQHAAWLLHQLAPFCGRHILKVEVLLSQSCS